MGQNGNTACAQDQGYGLLGRHLFPRDEIFRVVAQILGEGVRAAFDVTVLQQVGGIVGPRDHRTGISGLQLLEGDVDTGRLQVLAHPDIAACAGIYELLQFRPKGRGVIGDIQAYDVDVLFLVFRGKFNTRNDFDAVLSGLCKCLRM